MKLFLTAVLLFFSTTTSAVAQTTQQEVFLFGRDDCSVCTVEKNWLEAETIPYTYLNIIEDQQAAEWFAELASKHKTARVTPLTIVGDHAFFGFDGPGTTGAAIQEARTLPSSAPITSPADHITYAPTGALVGDGCGDSQCTIPGPFGLESTYTFTLPFIGETDLQSFSLFSLSLILGTVDGFNPCAMWVLITFLVLLTQAGDRKRMALLAGIFIIAEAVMYNLILNVWYTAWDFVALDQIVTPLVGALAFGGGAFFLYRWYRQRDLALVCDITTLEQQSRLIGKLKALITAPLTLITLLSVLVIAFSVNIIEFACSLGIPQAYTKILELNSLSFVSRQFYILVYTIGYMLDDLLVFGLAIIGYGALQAHGAKYARFSLLIGGILMLLLGGFLIGAPEALVL